MTLEDIKALCPPPEGMEWRPDGAVGFMCCSKTLDGRVVVINPAYPTFGVHWSVTAESGGEVFASRAVTLSDLPAAYRRALQAVGLASPWTSEVPTEAGLYLVDEPFPGPGGRVSHDTRLMQMHDGEWATIGGADEFEPRAFHGGARFLPLSNLKEPK